MSPLDAGVVGVSLSGGAPPAATARIFKTAPKSDAATLVPLDTRVGFRLTSPYPTYSNPS